MAHSCQSALKYQTVMWLKRSLKVLPPPGRYYSIMQAINPVLHPSSFAFWHNSSVLS